MLLWWLLSKTRNSSISLLLSLVTGSEIPLFHRPDWDYSKRDGTFQKRRIFEYRRSRKWVLIRINYIRIICDLRNYESKVINGYRLMKSHAMWWSIHPIHIFLESLHPPTPFRQGRAVRPLPAILGSENENGSEREVVFCPTEAGGIPGILVVAGKSKNRWRFQWENMGTSPINGGGFVWLVGESLPPSILNNPARNCDGCRGWNHIIGSIQWGCWTLGWE